MGVRTVGKYAGFCGGMRHAQSYSTPCTPGLCGGKHCGVRVWQSWQSAEHAVCLNQRRASPRTRGRPCRGPACRRTAYHRGAVRHASVCCRPP